MSNNRTTYEKLFEAFSTNINLAARILFYNSAINQHAKKNEKVLEALNVSARFWLDTRYSNAQSVIIILGRILDKGKKTIKIERLQEKAKKSGVFTKETLREFKIKSSDNYEDWLDDYIKNSYQLDESDWEELDKFVKNIQEKWNQIENVRHKIFAHEELLNEEEKLQILKSADYEKVSSIINDLLIIEHILYEAQYNGVKPDYSYHPTRQINLADNEIDKMLERLTR